MWCVLLSKRSTLSSPASNNRRRNFTENDLFCIDLEVRDLYAELIHNFCFKMVSSKQLYSVKLVSKSDSLFAISLSLIYVIFPPPLEFGFLLNYEYWYHSILNWEFGKLLPSLVSYIHKMSFGTFWVISRRLMISSLKKLIFIGLSIFKVANHRISAVGFP